ncbi:hypothetical protein DFJ58DRAFT_159646 [Suillus subalutaceus]|uniref:uncharacterized protein n=1 Tax=Suillus subalutaceus TaxID=48586 RepID=UPI001B86F118|nr:uncharacterized protein DFJ58DRAFT_159646 [Suillus subalutaceus]KAG1836816.1 hypothetical protein DFJ58DRAFT_159646 [Suillus subalutaceus]
MVCPMCKLHQGSPDRHPPANFVWPVPAQKFFLSFQSSPSSLSSSPVFRSTTPCDITTSTLDLPYFANCKRLSITSDATLVACNDNCSKDVLLPFQHYLSSPVLESTPYDITTTLDLPNLAICKRLSVASDTTLVASDDDLKVVFSDKDTYAMPHPGVHALAHTTPNDVHVDVPAPSTTIDIISPFCTPYIRPLVLLVDKCRTMPTPITNHSIPRSVHLTDTLLQTTQTVNSLHSSPSAVPNDDFIHSKGIFTGTDEALPMDTKDVEYPIDTLSPRMPALTTNNALIIENAFPIRNAPSHPLNL